MPAWLIDAALAAAFLVVGVLTTSGATEPGATVVFEPRDTVAWVLVLAATLPYVVRSRWPLPVLMVTSSAAAGLFLLDHDGGSLPPVVAVGLYPVASRRPWREVVVGAALLAGLLVAMFLSDAPGFGGGELIGSLGAYAAVLFVGWTMQSRHQRVEALQRVQHEAALRAAADERLRIAHE